MAEKANTNAVFIIYFRRVTQSVVRVPFPSCKNLIHRVHNQVSKKFFAITGKNCSQISGKQIAR